MKLISNRIEPKSPLYTEMIVNGCKFEEHFVTNYQQSIHTSKQHIINQFASDTMPSVFIFRNARQTNESSMDEKERQRKNKNEYIWLKRLLKFK
uniref:Uncharacterized protein n=1 Tax=Lactuca sativa TaxID=4236 RepID=A0A9R1VC52_LACSA|nr:hypothetical protein LSAT_V11C600341010 [Lactuca sativa]